MDPSDFTGLAADRAREAAAVEAHRRSLVGYHIAHLEHRMRTAGPSDQGEALLDMQMQADKLTDLSNRDPRGHALEMVSYERKQDAATRDVLDFMSWAGEDPSKTSVRNASLTAYNRRRVAPDIERRRILGRAKLDSQRQPGDKLSGIGTAHRIKVHSISAYENRSSKLVGVGQVDPSDPTKHAFVEFFVEEGLRSGDVPRRMLKGTATTGVPIHRTGQLSRCGVRMYIGDAHASPGSLASVGNFDVDLLNPTQRQLVAAYKRARNPADRQAAINGLLNVDPLDPGAPDQLDQLIDALNMVEDARNNGTAWIVP